MYPYCYHQRLINPSPCYLQLAHHHHHLSTLFLSRRVSPVSFFGPTWALLHFFTHKHTTPPLCLCIHTLSSSLPNDMRVQGHVCQGYRHRDRSTFSSLADVTLSLIIHSYPFEPFSFNLRPSLYISCITIYYTPINTHPPPTPPSPTVSFYNHCIII